MANQYFNISYDPAKQGFSADTWRKMYGDVAISAGQLELNKASILHYGDILRGDAVFSINIGAPVAGDNSRFGFTQFNKGAYLIFQISDGVLTAECSNGTISASSAVIPWNSSWTDTDTEFRIKWEAGMATFSIGGQFKVVFNDTYTLGVPTILVPGSPMSLYVASDSPDLMLLDYIIVKGIQSYVVSTGNSNSSFEVIVKESDKMAISDVITAINVSTAEVSKVDNLSVSDVLSEINMSIKISNTDSLSISENLSNTIDTNINIYDSLDISEDNTTDTPS